MKSDQASTTALATSLMRALHTRADAAPFIDDPWGDRLVPPQVAELLHQRALGSASFIATLSPDSSRPEIVDAYLRSSAAYSAVLIRTRFTEDALHAARAAGTTQYVLVGAGFDSYALRMPSGQQPLDVFEVDHPATQNLKVARLREQLAAVPECVHFVAADLAAETLESALARTSFKRSATSFFSWLGVSMYLTRDANLAALRSIAACGAPGSELVFTYIDQKFFAAQPQADGGMQQLSAQVQSLGEPFLSGFDPDELRSELAVLGLELLQDFADDELIDRYDPQQRNRLRKNGGFSRIAHARVAAT